MRVFIFVGCFVDISLYLDSIARSRIIIEH